MAAATSLKRATIALTILATALSGCGVQQITAAQSSIANDAKTQATSKLATRPVVKVHSSSWLMGEEIRASKPQPAIYESEVVFNRSVRSLQDVADWISTRVGVRAVVDASVSAPSPMSTDRVAGAAPISAAGMPPLPPGMPTGAAVSVAPASTLATAPLDGGREYRYKGPLKGLLERVATAYGVWFTYRDGVVTFYRKETRTFDVSSLNEGGTLSGSITTQDSAANVGANGAASTSGSSGSNSGQTMTLSASVKPWDTLEATAKAIAGQGADVHADRELGVITITGTPPQCDRLERWIKELNASFSKSIAIDVSVYEVHLSNNENYGANLSLAYKSSSGHTGVSFSGASVPKVSGAASAMSLGATILSGPMAGSTAAVQALSALGNVSQVVQRSGMTQNGKALNLQAATDQDYVNQTQSTLAANVGATSGIQTATVTPGFTGSFLPRYRDGRIFVVFDMTLSNLTALEPYPPNPKTDQASVQLRTLQKSRFQQSVSLKPGDSLVITGMYQQTASVNKNGVGSPSFPLLGGGIDAQKKDTILAIVISARVL
ncbi:pilus assembly protein PilN [Burkholderia multivorans]|nr:MULTISPECIES: component of type II secretion apparatus [Burkholderia cepacia complex]EED97289.1 putative component of type II secretion apparatus [Burkholderia multivorans CGD1]PRE30466.1 pilus assembly protein PilN [Burkholderia multivorans]PRF42414.1 pilus assembly protein PilN [Burkholderia multivorans]QSL64010.1 pilus assembly protein PilN [Burkholderia multivorans]HEJ2440031.1 pilus assembly protein PilN [Burkholderia multivorans]